MDAWLEAKQVLEQAMPWTAEWLRLGMIEGDRRAAYLALMQRQADAADEMCVKPSSVPVAMARPEVSESRTR